MLMTLDQPPTEGLFPGHKHHCININRTVSALDSQVTLPNTALALLPKQPTPRTTLKRPPFGQFRYICSTRKTLQIDE